MDFREGLLRITKKMEALVGLEGAQSYSKYKKEGSTDEWEMVGWEKKLQRNLSKEKSGPTQW